MWLLFLILSPSLALFTREPPPPLVTSRATVQERWLNVDLNHFDASNTDTFPMRYYYNDEFVQVNNSNIVIFVGGEWAIHPGWVSAGLAYELGNRTSSAVIYTEHRYYGQTRPSSTTSLAELRFLNVDQALGDLAQFIEHVKSDAFEDGKFRNASVGLVGCSYAGSMATWMRLAYPHLVDVAFSDSGPLYAQEDFPEYLEVITESLVRQGSQACVDTISLSISTMVELLKSDAGAREVSSLFNTCTEIRPNVSLDISTFFWYGITETFAELVQYADPGDITAACQTITNSAISTVPMERLAAWVTNRTWTQPCIEPRYEEVVRKHTNLSYDAPDATMRLWTYQTCVEYGWYQTTSSTRQPFLSTVPLEYFHQMCKDFFSNDTNVELLRSGIKRTNLLFGGMRLPDHVLSVAGGIDPWSPMGPNITHSTPLAPVYFIPDASHCMAVGSTAPRDVELLREAQQSILDNMTLKMTGQPEVSSAFTFMITPILLLANSLIIFV
ncbi:putative serine protease K12H4.7 [Leptidea sinapis]|uniref:putative serine protease K12H4.7 n=1 Tax=Leptidea sinapis TaxID=189913 RepID=UPI0021401ECE|nr:putative serine protease K12H4.7 [Leptidea sinapis]